MKKRKIIIGALIAVLILSGIALFGINRGKSGGVNYVLSKQKDVYYCPMHPGYTSDKPGDCPICGMKLVKKTASPKQERKILYYRNPMNPEITSPVPMKDAMGMDYVPVYENEEIAQEQEGIYISPQKQQTVGIKKEKVMKRKLTQQILTVGSVAYDPDLFVAQQEYVQALRTKERLSLGTINEQADSLVEAAKNKLLLLGMSEEEINKLAQQGKPQENLYLPLKEDKIWIYAVIYEYDLGLVKEGQTVTVESIAFPGEEFEGRIIAIRPVLDAMTRSAQIRIEMENPEHKLKPEMFVNARINIELGEKLALPEEAVIDTGERSVVFVAKPNGYFASRQVILGAHAGDYYEVLSGLSEGEEVVSSGNFFVDSESRLKSVINAEEHKHNQ